MASFPRQTREMILRILFALPGLHRVHRGAEVAFESIKLFINVYLLRDQGQLNLKTFRRGFYVQLHLTADLLYPIVVGLFFALFTVRVLSAVRPGVAIARQKRERDGKRRRRSHCGSRPPFGRPDRGHGW